jgi:hypothetical protein
MGEQDRPQSQRAPGQGGLDGGRLAGVDDERLAAVVVQQPDVVVGERR